MGIKVLFVYPNTYGMNMLPPAIAMFSALLKKNGHKIISLDNKSLIYAIKKSCQIKSEIVSEDEKEKGIREILNLGHTFGHAIESQTGFSKKILHGEAVFLGIF